MKITTTDNISAAEGQITARRTCQKSALADSFCRMSVRSNEFNDCGRRAADAVTNVHVDAKETVQKDRFSANFITGYQSE